MGERHQKPISLVDIGFRFGFGLAAGAGAFAGAIIQLAKLIKWLGL